MRNMIRRICSNIPEKTIAYVQQERLVILLINNVARGFNAAEGSFIY